MAIRCPPSPSCVSIDPNYYCEGIIPTGWNVAESDILKDQSVSSKKRFLFLRSIAQADLLFPVVLSREQDYFLICLSFEDISITKMFCSLDNVAVFVTDPSLFLKITKHCEQKFHFVPKLSEVNLNEEVRNGLLSFLFHRTDIVNKIRRLTPERSGIPVIISTLNEAESVVKYVECLLSQREDLFVCVFDNGSCDDSADLLQNYEPQICVVSLPSNVGKSLTQNTGFIGVKGMSSYIVSSDDDILFPHEESVSWLIEDIKSLKDPSILAPCLYRRNGTLHPNMRITNIAEKERLRSGRTLSKTHQFAGVFLVMASKFLDSHGPFPERFFYGDDESSLRYRARNFPVGAIDEIKCIAQPPIMDARGVRYKKWKEKAILYTKKKQFEALLMLPFLRESVL